MKLFLIIPTLKQGGAERVMSELANQFSQKNTLEVHLVLLAQGDDFYSVHQKITIHRLGFENRGRVLKVISELLTLRKLRKLLKQHKPDAVLSFMEKYNSFTLLSSLFLGLRIFVSDRSNPLKEISKSIERLRKVTYRYATGIVAQTQLAKDILEKKVGHKNIRVIPNPVKEIQRYPHVKREKIILSVGRLIPEKGHKYLIEAFSKLNNREDWSVIILGDGILRTELEDQIKQLNLQNQVKLLGAVNNIDQYLAKASIFVFPSISEGFPNALIEAMSAGLPCLSFDCDAGPRDVIENKKNGILIEPKNIDELILSLTYLIEKEEIRNQIGEEASKIASKLAKNRISEEYLEFLLNSKY